MSETLRKFREFNIVPYLVIFYMVGVVGMIIPQTREVFIRLVPYNLMLNILLLFLYHGKITSRFLWPALAIYLAGFFIEVLGVGTGLIFGSYTYGTILGPQVFHTPLLIGINWLMLVYGSLVISSWFMETRYFRVLIAAVLMVVYDFALEPAAIDIVMWDWGGPVPFRNYIAWFLISLVMAWFADLTGMVNKQNKIAAPLFFIQLGFFVILDIWMWIKEIWALS